MQSHFLCVNTSTDELIVSVPRFEGGRKTLFVSNDHSLLTPWLDRQKTEIPAWLWLQLRPLLVSK